MILQGLLNKVFKMTYPSGDCREGKSIIFHGLKFYFIGILLSAVVCFYVAVLIKIAHLNVINNTNTEAFYDDIRANLFRGFLVVAFSGPLIEECMFRLWMTFKRKTVWISVFFITYNILTLIMPGSDEGFRILGLNPSFANFWPLKLFISIVAALLFLRIKQETFCRISQAYGEKIINWSVFLFACLHVGNYTFDWFCFPCVLLLCLPQLVLGITITYYRQKIGFWSGLLFHCLINVISLSLSI